MSELKSDQFTARLEAQRQQTFQVYKAWIKKHPEIPDCIAVQKMFEEYCDFTDPLVEADFEFAYSHLKSRMSVRRIPTEAAMKAELTDEIIELLRTGGSGHTQHSLHTERTKCSFRSLAQLQARRDEIVGKQAAGEKSVPQLRAELREATRDARKYSGYPDLPLEWVPPQRVRAVKVDAAFIRSLPPQVLRQWASRYGFEQINDALRERV